MSNLYPDSFHIPWVIDFHTHIFPDHLAPKAIQELREKCGGIRAYTGGTAEDLLHSMERAHIQYSVVAHVATKPEHARSILQWSRVLRKKYPQLISFPSFLPTQPDALEILKIIHREGFLGIKLHPYYQDFILDNPTLTPVFAKIEELGLILLLHTGYDIGFPKDTRCTPPAVLKLLHRFPNLRLIAAHFGSWGCWQEVLNLTHQYSCYVDLAMVRPFVTPGFFRTLLLHFPSDRILFATDSPWSDQRAEIDALRSLHLPPIVEYNILYRNATKLLNISPP